MFADISAPNKLVRISAVLRSFTVCTLITSLTIHFFYDGTLFDNGADLFAIKMPAQLSIKDLFFPWRFTFLSDGGFIRHD